MHMFNLEKYKILVALILCMTVFAACGKKEAPVVDTTVEPVRIAVASGFLPTAKLLAAQFTTNTGIGVELTGGSDQELVGMIVDGSEIDVFMASDAEHPRVLIDKGKAMADGAFVYALGTAVLYSRDWKVNWTGVKYLKSGQFNTLSIPNDDNRYGRAGILALENVGVYEAVQKKLVLTENEAESFELVDTRQVDSGFIAFSSLSDEDKRWAWIVPQAFYPPIEQGAVLVKTEPVNESARIWMGYLNSEGARSIIQQSGYGIIGSEEVTSSH